jgi:prepilin-type N-terminal cleavage/methylation domain-containing protein
MKRRGFTLIELLVVVAIIALLIAILLPSLGKARELSNRSVCAANVRGIGQSMAVYAKDNNDQYPIVCSTGSYALTGGGNNGTSTSVDSLLSSINPGLYSRQSASITQNMWVLVLTGQVAPKQYLCKSDPATTVTAVANYGGSYRSNFNDGVGNSGTAAAELSYSYSFAYPWTQNGPVGGWWRDTTDAGLPLISDMAPMGTSGTSGTNTPTPTDKQSNSFNHQRDGQNVGFGDSHAEFARRPDCGQSADNLFTTNAGITNPNGSAFTGASVPRIGTGGIPGAYDVCVCPVADAGSSFARK